MATVTNTIKLPDGTAPTYAAVEIDLVASDDVNAGEAGWITATDVTVLATARPTVTAGAWSATLAANDTIDPSGTVYRVREYVDRQRFQYYISVPTGGGTVHDLLTSGPASLMFDSVTNHNASAVAHTGFYRSGGTDVAVADGGTGASTAQAARSSLAAQRMHALDVRDYSAAGDGVTNDTAAIQAAIDALGTAGGEIMFPVGTYLCTGALTVGTTAAGITFTGASGRSSARGSRLLFSGTGSGSFLTVKGDGFAMRNMVVLYSSASFTGTLIDLRPSVGQNTSDVSINECYIGSTVPASTRTCTALNLVGAHTVNVTGCVISGTNIAAIGRDGTGGANDFSNRILFQGCAFLHAATTYAYDPGEAWTFDGCTFEAVDSTPRGVICSRNAKSLRVVGCWLGDDSSVAADWIVFQGEGLTCHSNVLSADHASACFVKFSAASHGVVIQGNRIRGSGVLVDVTATGVAATSSGFVITGNYSASGTVAKSGTLPSYSLMQDATGVVHNGVRYTRTVYTSSDTWNKPSYAKKVTMIMVGGGGGGGSGRVGAAASVRCGGGGGSSGYHGEWVFHADDVPSSLTVLPGAGGAGGTAQASSDSSGNAGSDGTQTTVSNGTWLLRARGGAGGLGGTATTGTGGGSPGVTGANVSYNAGASASTTGGAGTAGSAGWINSKWSQGGSSGGGITSGNTESAGGGGSATSWTAQSGGAAGTAGGGNGGDSVAVLTGMYYGAPHPGGGGSSVSGNGGTGGSGVAGGYGVGGGGGGAAANGNSSGAGGAGAAGVVVVIVEG